jgi:hypothetical protein
MYRQSGYPTTQRSLLNDYPGLCFVGRVRNGQDISGALYPDEFEALCTELGLRPSRFQFAPEDIDRLENPEHNQGTIFYSASFDGNPAQSHYFRFLEMKQPDWFWFMNPTDATLFRATAQHLIDWQTEFFVLNLPPSFGDI